MKKFVSLLLVLVLCASFAVSASAITVGDYNAAGEEDLIDDVVIVEAAKDSDVIANKDITITYKDAYEKASNDFHHGMIVDDATKANVEIDDANFSIIFAGTLEAVNCEINKENPAELEFQVGEGFVLGKGQHVVMFRMGEDENWEVLPSEVREGNIYATFDRLDAVVITVVSDYTAVPAEGVLGAKRKDVAHAGLGSREDIIGEVTLIDRLPMTGDQTDAYIAVDRESVKEKPLVDIYKLLSEDYYRKLMLDTAKERGTEIEKPVFALLFGADVYSVGCQVSAKYPATLKFTLGKDFKLQKGQALVLLRWNGKAWKVMESELVDGGLVAEFTALGPVAIVLVSEDGLNVGAEATLLSNTGVVGGTPMFRAEAPAEEAPVQAGGSMLWIAVLAIVALGGGAVVVAKSRKNNAE